MERIASDADTLNFQRLVRAGRADAERWRHAPPPASDIPGDSSAPHTAAETPPFQLAGYLLLNEVFRGGQAVVYEATHLATRRHVAIKLFRRETGIGGGDQRRFEREAELLTQLRHPNIVTVHDAGSSPAGFYIVMDFVAGQPLDAFIAAKAATAESGNVWTTRDTLRLFAQVCDAVNAAHLRGVIHRDLKPANILVDADGAPRVVDFGLAKLVADPGSDHTLTQAGQFLGSLRWASPEQAAGDHTKIDIRTDVYSLGVILYNLLTGRFPYDVTGSMRDVLNHIVQSEPARPRSVAHSSTLPSAPSDVPNSFVASWLRGFVADPGIDSDLEAIVLKCLSKIPAGRYQSAGDLAADLRRYLAGEAIEAKRDSALYVLGKALRRYRGPAAVAAGSVLLITAGFVTSFANWQLAGRERDRAVLAEKEQYRERERAVAGERAAAHEAERARNVKALLDEMLELPARRSPTGEELSFQEHLAAFAESLRQHLERQPEIEADMRLSVGKTYSLLAFYTEAEEQFRRALEIRRRTSDELDPDVNGALQALADLVRKAGRHNEAVRLFQDGIERARRVSRGDHETLAWRLSQLSMAQIRAGDLPAAEATAREALGIRERLNGWNHPDVALSLAQLSLVFRTIGRHDDAIALARQAVEIDRATLGETDRTTTVHIEQLAVALRAAGHYQATVDVWRDGLRRAVEIHGDEHLAVAERMRQVAHFLFWIPDSAAEQATLFRAVLDLRRRLAPGDGAVLRRALWRTAEMHWLDGDLAAAEDLLQEAVDLLPRDRIEDNHTDTNVMLAVVLRDRGALEQAEAAMRRALRLEQDEMPKRFRWFRGVLHYELAAILRMRGDAPEAAKQESQAAEIFQSSGPWYHLGYAARFEAIGRHMLNIRNYESAADALGWAVRMRAAICPGHRTHREAEDLLKVALAKVNGAATGDEALSVAPDGSDPEHPP